MNINTTFYRMPDLPPSLASLGEIDSSAFEGAVYEDDGGVKGLNPFAGVSEDGETYTDEFGRKQPIPSSLRGRFIKQPAGTGEEQQQQAASQQNQPPPAEAQKPPVQQEAPPKEEPKSTGTGEEREESAEVTPEAFFEEVDKITGSPVKVEYPADVDPLSPQGVAIRDKVIRELAMEEFDAAFEKRDARAYAYALHRQAGGDDESFFNKDNPGFVLPSPEDLAGNTDTQKQMYTAGLRGRGRDQGSIDTLVEKAVKDGKLKDLAEREYRAAKKDEDDRVARLQKAKNTEEEAYQTSVKQAIVAIENTMTKLQFTVPETEKGNFRQFMLDNMLYNQGRFYLSTQVTDANLVPVMEAMFMLSRNGKLDDIVKREVKREAAQSLRLRTTGSEKREKDHGDTGGKAGEYIPLGQLGNYKR